MIRVRRAEEEEASLSMTPLIDCVLLLLIFYIVTTSFVDREIELQLPESQSSSVPEEKKKFTVELGVGGAIALNSEPVTIDQLDLAIGREAAADNIRAVEIRADRRVIHGRVVRQRRHRRQAGTRHGVAGPSATGRVRRGC
jgi:biopolymer transport protein ExbD